MLNHTTTIIFRLPQAGLKNMRMQHPLSSNQRDWGAQIADQYARVAEMVRLLENRGFVFTCEGERLKGSSEQIEAQDLRELLFSHGFSNGEYQIYLEYQRKWGIL